jgi:hypothetical protein
MPVDEETGAQLRVVLAGGGVIEVGGSTVDDPETGEPVPAAVLRLPLWQLTAVAGAVDMWNRVSALVTVSGGCVPADDGLGAALTWAADALAGCDRGTTRAGGVAGPDPAAARRVAVVRAHHAALDWARVITGSPLARTGWSPIWPLRLAGCSQARTIVIRRRCWSSAQ